MSWFSPPMKRRDLSRRTGRSRSFKPTMSDSAPIVGDSVITLDIHCVQCAYNLRGSTIDANCPECGRPVRDTVPAPQEGQYEVFALTPEQRRKRLRSARRASLLGFGLMAIYVAMLIAVAWSDPTNAPFSVGMASMMAMFGALLYFVSQQNRAFVDHVLVVTDNTMALTRPYMPTVVLARQEMTVYFTLGKWFFIRASGPIGLSSLRIPNLDRIEAILQQWNIAKSRTAPLGIAHTSAFMVATLLSGLAIILNNLVVYIVVALPATVMIGHYLAYALLASRIMLPPRWVWMTSLILIVAYPAMVALAVYLAILRS